MIAIIDYDAGNIKSVEKAVDYLGYEVVLTRDKEVIKKADKLILPGVGAFGDSMEKLHKYGLCEVITEEVKAGKPILGICLGLQVLFEESEESPGVKGLGLLKGKIVKLPVKEGFKIPHMGWNDITVVKNGKLFEGIDKPYVYFVHSYYLKCEEEDAVAATTDYTALIHAAVEKDNIFATQFHPEKSGDIGLKILDNYCRD
ncbi:MAG: imidazole glycerol phosphate synthase subunit HisH [Lachnospiraceae bacterium]|nr:imidazole glycerol phosphate synthase subunit HisH [Lachnospiraceae bacterium]